MRSTTASSSASDLTWAAASATAPGSAVNGAASQGAAAAVWPGAAGDAAGMAAGMAAGDAAGVVDARREGRAAPAGKAKATRADRARRDFRVLLMVRDIASPGGEGAPGAGRRERGDFTMPLRQGPPESRYRIGPAFPGKCHCTAIRFAGDEMTGRRL